MAITNKGILSVPVEGGASCISFSAHKDSSNLFAVGGPSKITVKSCKLEEKPQTSHSLLDVISVEHVFETLYNNASHICWSPATDIDTRNYRYCAHEKDSGSITVFSSTEEATTIETLEGHRAIINDLCTHPTDKTLLASVGDDCMCRVWDLQRGQLRSEYKLGSPGMSVQWHELDPVKLMVAEKSGRVRFYDILGDSPILSLDCPSPPLMDVDWAPSNSLLVGGVAGGSWFLWDLSQSSQPFASKFVHKTPIVKFGWCRQNDDVFATLSSASQLKIHHITHQRVPMTCDLLVASDLSWHNRIPLVGVACDNKVNCLVAET